MQGRAASVQQYFIPFPAFPLFKSLSSFDFSRAYAVEGDSYVRQAQIGVRQRSADKRTAERQRGGEVAITIKACACISAVRSSAAAGARDERAESGMRAITLITSGLPARLEPLQIAVAVSPPRPAAATQTAWLQAVA
ncbi:hypothetical protein EVAR_11749_1 [Eumeta japonica]|uniref:Uncharacterized protein n=1 Tax=Eumeta variegata TaxID=151549 RepID=A0A4C1UPZ9_EUMVA|nr:hypothetical protein EVAR_11749_1 [Eumeta japonica]